ncbi:MAG: NifU family protein [Peptostreptococcaceae bacterium]|nr:NifU family protein [Peptostreptococcaceae bacterium]
MSILKEEIKEIIEKEIRPEIVSHGGDIELSEIKGEVVYIKLTGMCSNCPSAQMTTENLVERKLKEHLGDKIDRVVLKNEVSEDMLSLARKILNKTI